MNLHEKIKSVLFRVAVGDALGEPPVEFNTREEISISSCCVFLYGLLKSIKSSKKQLFLLCS